MNTTLTFAGNLVDDVELRYTPTGKAVASFRVLVNRRVKDGEQWKDGEPTGFNCEIWGVPAENAAESYQRGNRVLVTGELITEAWDKDGEKQTRPVVRVEEIAASTTFATVTITRAERSAAAQD
ncbi:single-stranded DNA-binding protein [Nocardioides hankookensis]|uniref:Single-stranded DNA-binding protein n=1 Tax=Nocardioides hankookensis TaxID=443157 RepID=A0ABW1LNW3_9ACTN